MKNYLLFTMLNILLLSDKTMCAAASDCGIYHDSI